MLRKGRLAKFVCAVILSASISPKASSTEVVIRYVDVAFVSWSGAKPHSVLRENIEQALDGEVSDRWRRYSRVDQEVPIDKIVFNRGQTLQGQLILDSKFPCDGPQVNVTMNSIRSSVYAKLNISQSDDRYLVVVTPDAGCIWTGRAFIGGRFTPGGTIVMHNSANPFVLIHELGHALGLGHSNLLRCDSGLPDGPWGRECRAVEYGGAIDVMGNIDVDTPLTTYGQWLIGLIQDQEVHQSWLSEEIVLGASDVQKGIRAIYLRDGKSAYWIEYRRQNSNATYKPGLAVFRVDPPPISAILSPNPEDSVGPAFGMDVVRDVWMLNWDDYLYLGPKASGSMTLPFGQTATVFSGNVSFSARATESVNQVRVKIDRRPDSNPPPAPVISNPNYWGISGAPVIDVDYDDGESAISGFDLSLSGNVVYSHGSEANHMAPTYLNPLSQKKTLYLKDLPEGSYNLSIRGIDIWGNKSSWSQPKEVLVDREFPITGTEFFLTSPIRDAINIEWSGAFDRGSKLCRTTFQNKDGFVLSRSEKHASPNLSLPGMARFDGMAEVFDCLGNGIRSSLKFTSKQSGLEEAKRIGKWATKDSQFGPNTYACIGKCSASMTVKGTVGLELKKCSPNLFIGGKIIPRAKVRSLDGGNFVSIAVGPRTQVLRIAGSNFELGAVYQAELTLADLGRVARAPILVDESLDDPGQRDLGLLGFKKDDFSNGWQVLPMPRGTTLIDPTLDLCSSKYVSESGRLSRRQITVSSSNSPYLFLSTEAVKYKSVSAAEAALAELKKNYEACVINKGGTENGIFTPYAFQALPKSEAKLVDEKNRVVVSATIGSGTSARQLLAFYQYEGAYFTGLYIVLAGEKPITDSEVLRWFDVAEIMANRLSAKK